MILIVPIGGTGQRFVEAGYQTPKPWLEVGGQPLLWWALRTHQPLAPHTILLWRATNATKPTSHLSWPVHLTLTFDGATRGPLETVLRYRPALPPEEDVVIADCDSWLDPEEWRTAVQTFRDEGAAGGVTVRQTTDPACSYVVLDPTWHVVEAREKDVCSPWSSTGPYWFKTWALFHEAAEAAQKMGATTIAPIYNEVRKAGPVRAVPVESFVHIGDPATYERYLTTPLP